MEEYIWQEGVALKANLEEKPFRKVLEIMREEKVDEFRVANTNFEIEFWYYDDKFIITHFRSYTSGYGTKVVKKIEETFNEKFNTLSIRIGTERGEQKTIEFLKKITSKLRQNKKQAKNGVIL